MELQLENLKYQDTAIQAVIKVFDGTEKNTFDNACIEGIRSNFCKLTAAQLADNITAIAKENGIDDATAKYSADNDLCIEMETGTGKTLVYIKTIYELYKHYAFTKFIILVPSIAIRQGTLGTFKTFEKQLESIYGFKVQAFDYDSKKLNKVTNFIEEQHPQVMIMTTGAFSSDDRILNRTQREDLFNNLPYIDAIAKVRPFIFMDEPQEGMDSDNMMERLKTLSADERKERYSNKVNEREKTIFKTLDPLFKIRYSATHKTVKNLLYRLTPYDSYKDGLVKKIEVLTVTEKNDEATIKIELTEAQNGTSDLKVKLKAWRLKGGKYVFENTNWLKVGDNLGEKTQNTSYLNYKIERIYKDLRIIGDKWRVKFSNGVEIQEKQIAGNKEKIWELQLHWLIHRHFAKSQKLEPQGIKVLSLIFIDKVSNYMGEEPKIKNLFVEKYKAIYREYNDGKIPTDQYIRELQGYYFAQNAKGEFSDNEGGLKEQKKIYELILQKKDELLTIGNPIEFVFSHSALGVGWDNPNVFNIATLNTAYSDIRKRQEIGRGLRICVNQQGQRVYDRVNAEDIDRVNQLTVIPNETYETFVMQYQEEIKAIYGSTAAGAGMTHTHKDKPQNEVHFKRSENDTINKAFKRFWKSLARKTDYSISINETDLINEAVKQLKEIKIEATQMLVASGIIDELSNEGIKANFAGTATYSAKSYFTPLDLIEELSENTSLSYVTTCKIIKGIAGNYDSIKNNPPKFLHEAESKIKSIELDFLKRDLTYHLTGGVYENDKGDIDVDKLFHDEIRNIDRGKIVDTPFKGVFDKMIADSNSKPERHFALGAENDPDVVCFLKLPNWYKIPTPIGNYEPDFGIVMKKKLIDKPEQPEYYFVIETKDTNNINDLKALRGKEVYLIECAKKHFEALGIELHYEAPVKEYQTFKAKADTFINEIIQ
jgi:type III restriction enzyme